MTVRWHDLPSPLYNRPSRVATAYAARFGVPTGESASYVADGPVPGTVWLLDGMHPEPRLVPDPTTGPRTGRGTVRRIAQAQERARVLTEAMRGPHIPVYDGGTLAALLALVDPERTRLRVAFPVLSECDECGGRRATMPGGPQTVEDVAVARLVPVDHDQPVSYRLARVQAGPRLHPDQYVQVTVPSGPTKTGFMGGHYHDSGMVVTTRSHAREHVNEHTDVTLYNLPPML